jgi:hypothetical protein
MDYTLFEAWPANSVLLLPDAPTYTIVAVSNHFVRTSGFSREDAIGRGLIEFFPQNPDDLHFRVKQKVEASLHHVLCHKESHQLPLQRYDIPNGDGTFSERYWKFTNVPIISDSRAVRYIIHTAEAITTPSSAAQPEDQFKHIENAYDLFMQAPVAVCIVKGPSYIVELANVQMLQLLGRTAAMVGKRLDESLPEARV